MGIQRLFAGVSPGEGKSSFRSNISPGGRPTPSATALGCVAFWESTSHCWAPPAQSQPHALSDPNNKWRALAPSNRLSSFLTPMRCAATTAGHRLHGHHVGHCQKFNLPTSDAFTTVGRLLHGHYLWHCQHSEHLCEANSTPLRAGLTVSTSGNLETP